MLLIHHPPVTEAARHKRLLDAPVLKRVIAAHGADLLLHGHDHLHMINWLEGPNGTRVPAVGVPSASARSGTDKDAAAYNLYRIDGTRGAWRCELISRGLGSCGRGRATKALHADWLGVRIAEHRKREQRSHASDEPIHEGTDGAPAAPVARAPQYRLRNAASCVVGQCALTLDQPTARRNA